MATTNGKPNEKLLLFIRFSVLVLFILNIYGSEKSLITAVT